MYPDWLLGAIFFLFGLIFGSFLNVCIYRLPRGLSVVSPRSACPDCHAPIAAYDNIPVLSWLMLGGRCRHCHGRISPRYAIVELLCGLLFLSSFLHFGLTLLALKGCVFSFLFLGLAFTDAETRLLPDAMTLPGLAAGLAFSFFLMVPGPAFWIMPSAFSAHYSLNQAMFRLSLCSFANSLLGAAIGAGILLFIGWLYRWLRKVEGMGMGDVKLMAMYGACAGAVHTVFVLCTASLLGGAFGIYVLAVIFRKRYFRYRTHLQVRAAARSWQAAQIALRGLEIPFGTFLCIMALFSLFYGTRVIQAYFGLFFR